MRFLCLHGMGTNNQIFEMQTAAIRYELGAHHTYEFLEGSVPHPMAQGVETIASSSDEFFSYLDDSSQDKAAEDCAQAFKDLDAYLESYGPFDAVMAFSQGAGLAATYIIYKAKECPDQPPPFACGVFFCGGVPGDPIAALQGSAKHLNPAVDGELINIPTAHIWGANDQLYPTFGPVLHALCKAETRSSFIHEGGHEIPGSASKIAVMKTVHAIRRAIALFEDENRA